MTIAGVDTNIVYIVYDSIALVLHKVQEVVAVRRCDGPTFRSNPAFPTKVNELVGLFSALSAACPAQGGKVVAVKMALLLVFQNLARLQDKISQAFVFVEFAHQRNWVLIERIGGKNLVPVRVGKGQDGNTGRLHDLDKLMSN